MLRMTLCPNCRTIQKEGTRCTICTCPVDKSLKKKDARNDDS